MISILEGEAICLTDSKVIVMCKGVGYEVATPSNIKIKDGEKIRLYTHLISVIEGSRGTTHLYGFKSGREKEMFLTLLGVSGVGPRLAMEILSVFTPSDFTDILFSQNSTALTRVSGLGKKKAESILFHLKDKIKATGIQEKTLNSSSTEALSALMVLGFSQEEASKAISTLSDSYSKTEDIIKAALASMANKE